MDFTISVAGTDIGVSSMFGEVYELCGDYLTDNAPQIQLTIGPGDIAFEREKSLREAAAEGRIIAFPSDPYLETLAVYRRIAVEMTRRGALLMHGSVVGVNGEAVMFTAPSGVGKTTHTRLWLDNIPGSFVLNGDKPLIRLTDSAAEACGTPWSGKEGLNTNAILPLRAICLLTRGSEDAITEVPFTRVYPMLLQQTYRPAEPDAMRRTLELFRRLGGLTRFYILRCTMEPHAALTAYSGIFGNKL